MRWSVVFLPLIPHSSGKVRVTLEGNELARGKREAWREGRGREAASGWETDAGYARPILNILVKYFSR